MTAQEFPSARKASRRPAMLAAALVLAAGAASAHGQGVGSPDPIAELIRRADAKAAEDGLCATVNWPPGDRQIYVHFLDSARVGFAKVNTFKNGADCQFDVVTQVYEGQSGRCVRYIWRACARGSTCDRGEDTDCKQGGRWVRQ